MVLVIMTAATLIIVVVVMVLVIMATATLVIMVVMMVLVIVAASTLVVMVVVMVLMLLVVIVAATALAVMVMMVVMMLFYLLKVNDRALHGIEHFLAAQNLNRCGDNVCFRIQLAEHLYRCLYLCGVSLIGTAQDNSSCTLNLVLEKLAEISKIHFAFHNVDYGCCGVQGYACFFFHTVYGFDDVGKFTYAGWLDDDTIRVIFGDDVF